MCDVPEAFTSSTRKARKSHTCCECLRAIPPGDRYEYVSGIWDGSPNSYATCLPCAGARAWLKTVTRDDDERCVVLGQLALALDREAGYEGARLWTTGPHAPGVLGHAAGLLMQVRLYWDDQKEERRRAQKKRIEAACRGNFMEAFGQGSPS